MDKSGSPLFKKVKGDNIFMPFPSAVISKINVLYVPGEAPWNLHYRQWTTCPFNMDTRPDRALPLISSAV